MLAAKEDLMEKAASILRAERFRKEICGYASVVDEPVRVFPVFLPLQGQVFAGQGRTLVKTPNMSSVMLQETVKPLLPSRSDCPGRKRG